MCRSEARRGRIIVAVDSNLHLCEECIDTLAPFVAECLKRRLLVNCTHGTVLRLLPALNLTDAELEEGCDILTEVLTQR